MIKSNYQDTLKEIELFNKLAGNHSLPRTLNDPAVLMSRNLVREEYNELEDAFNANDEVEVLDACADIIVVVVGVMLSLGHDPASLMQEVNSSNLSKFCKDEQEAQLTVDSYKDDVRYQNVHYSEVNGKYVIKGSVEGVRGLKILKGVNYRPADFKQFVNQFVGG
jgi:predicted HAD superfamily Cof-like phosphohydrolase